MQYEVGRKICKMSWSCIIFYRNVILVGGEQKNRKHCNRHENWNLKMDLIMKTQVCLITGSFLVTRAMNNNICVFMYNLLHHPMKNIYFLKV